MRDVVFHVADHAMEQGLRAFFRRPDWSDALGCAPFRMDPDSDEDIFRVRRYKDGGVYNYAHENLANHLGRYEYAVVILDNKFDPSPGVIEIERTIKANLVVEKWHPEKIAVIVIDPALEAWIWADDTSTARAFRIGGEFRFLRERLIDERLWEEGRPKPKDMKAAARRAADMGGWVSNNAIFQTVFSALTKDALDKCVDPAFTQMRRTLQHWFPPSNPGSAQP